MDTVHMRFRIRIPVQWDSKYFFLKKRPPEIRASQLVIRVKVYELSGTQCLIQSSQLGIKA